MRLSPERKKLAERIAALLALAENTTFDAEAQSARAAALRLMAEHNIDPQRMAEPFEERHIDPFFKDDVWWDRIIKFSLAELNNCYPTLWTSDGATFDTRGRISSGEVLYFCYVGRPSDLDAFEYMFGIVLRQRTKAWNDYTADGGGETKGKWLYGYAKGLEHKVETIRSELDVQMRGQGKNQLAPLSLLAQAKNWYEEQHGEAEHTLTMGSGGAADGFAAGSKVNLYRGEMTATRQLGAVRRITGPR